MEEPILPSDFYEPSLPKKFISIRSKIHIPYGSKSFQDILDLNPKYKTTNLFIKLSQYDDGPYCFSGIIVFHEELIENKKYFLELRKFKKSMKRFLKSKEEYKNNLLRYFEWMKDNKRVFTLYHENLKRKYCK